MPSEDMSREEFKKLLDQSVAEIRAEQAEDEKERRRKVIAFREAQSKKQTIVNLGLFVAALFLVLIIGLFSQPMSLEEAEFLDDYCPGPPYSNC